MSLFQPQSLASSCFLPSFLPASQFRAHAARRDGGWLSLRALQQGRPQKRNEVITQGSIPCSSGHLGTGPAPPSPPRLQEEGQGCRGAEVSPAQSLLGSNWGPTTRPKASCSQCHSAWLSSASEHDSVVCRLCLSRSRAGQLLQVA